MDAFIKAIHSLIGLGNDYIWGGNPIFWNKMGLLVFVLIAVGLFFTLGTRFVQIRFLKDGFKMMLQGRGHLSKGDISPFQAFVTGLASRVGTGNIAGVATAIAVGGPGAIFWMWITALLGMASAFAESTLAQVFKINHHDNTFRGGPAYYIQKGLGSRGWGVAFALSLILAFGFVFNAVQANSIVAATQGAWGWNPLYVGIGLVLLTMPIIFGGMRTIARVAELIVPIMAILYLGVSFFVVLTHLEDLPVLLMRIINGAFGLEQVAGGVAGSAIQAAMSNGIKRGLFSNEAGMGSAPNAAAIATTRHPVNQGIVQMMGVFVDTILICSSTAFIVLLADVSPDLGLKGVALTQKAMEITMGPWAVNFLAVAVFLFAFTSVIGNYAYAEGNLEFINKKPLALFLFRMTVLAMVMLGALIEVPVVWDMADLAMGIMALINLGAIILLSKTLFVVLNDYESQRSANIAKPIFKAQEYPELAKKIEHDVWQ